MSVALIILPDFFTVLCSLSLSAFDVQIADVGFRHIFCSANTAISRFALRRIVNLLLDISLFSPLFMHRKAHTTTIYTNITNTERSGDNSIKLKIGLSKAHQLRITEYQI